MSTVGSADISKTGHEKMPVVLGAPVSEQTGRSDDEERTPALAGFRVQYAPNPGQECERL